ncbi:myosin-like protein [Plasmopara halstedii]|uniref:Myosin-like protein n=1 Tax=Plasmopara halstedii TaxID=4781 RepID=A0A0P1ADC8_PLAHL|nr:myosin-like protein [Plasmopara halstedii]CEG38589.1 myosin-like protein [Plasmopara halstedii]|eukprot:XP_024574958.1 myosin-like protein [Plasmopara halstedii]
MSEQEISGVMEIVAAVLHMGNVDFEQVPHKREDNVFVDEARVKTSRTGLCDHFTKVAELLGVSTDALDHALTKRSLHASNEVLVVGVDVTQARNTCNALTMECYRLLFEWLVARINIKLQRHGSVEWDADADETDDEEEATDFIGLLDIFGFENMAENSFEQLCINYANEALQHQFNQYVFEEEQRLYRAEAIRWNFVDFPDNSACLELFEQRPIGIFSLTDQECVFPQGTDRALVAKFYLEFETKKIHPRFRSAPKFHRTTQFIVAHYAGSVIYSIEGFLAKNKDSFCESAAQLLAGSMNPFVQALAARSSNGDGFNGESELDGGRNRRRAKSAIAAISVGTQFKIQLNELLNTVRATTPRYVRCIKPNDLHVGSLFQSTRVVEQLRSGGVLEAVRVARAGFPVRLSHKQFLERYRRILLWLYELKNNGIDKKKHRNWSELDLCLHQLIRFLLTDSKSETGEDGAEGDQENEQNRCGVSLGKTRVFFRRTPYEKLENLRISVRQESSLVIQRQLKGFVARCNYRRLRQFTIVVQTWVRGRRAYRYVNWMRAMRQAQVLQARMRQLCARSKFLRARAGVLAVQCRFRCRLASRVLQALRECRAVTQIATAWRRFSAEHKYSKLCSATLALQCAVRAHTARKTLKLLRNESRDLAKLKEDNAQLKDELAELRRQMQVLVAHSSSKERQQASYSNFKFFEKSPQNAPFPSNETPAEFDNNKCITQLKLELSDDLVTVDTGGNPNAANGSDFGCVVDLPYSHHKLEQQTPTLRRGRRYSLPPALAPANEDAEVEHATPPAPPRAFRPHDRRYSLELWWRQEAEAQKEATQLREVIREAAADVFSPERQQQQELALQQLVASQIKRKTMQLQLQLPAFELGANNKDIDSGPASSICSRRRSRTADFLQGPAPLTSCGRQSRSRWNFAAPHSMTHGGNCRMPAYFDNPSYAGSSYGDDHSVDGGDEIYSRSHQVPRRSASVGVCRVRSSSNASSFNMPPSSNIRPGVVIPRFAKSPTCYECDCKFSFLLRRHHCRQCGNSFCFEHSTRQLALPHLGYMTAQRVCDSCFEAHIHIMTSLKLPSLMRNATDELSTSSFASSPRGLDSYCGFDSPTTTAARVAPLRT